MFLHETIGRDLHRLMINIKRYRFPEASASVFKWPNFWPGRGYKFWRNSSRDPTAAENERIRDSWANNHFSAFLGSQWTRPQLQLELLQLDMFLSRFPDFNSRCYIQLFSTSCSRNEHNFSIEKYKLCNNQRRTTIDNRSDRYLSSFSLCFDIRSFWDKYGNLVA